MAYRPTILLGRITKAVGFNGSVVIKLENSLTGNIPDMESVFIQVEGRPVPFFISWSEYPGGDTLRLKFEGYDSYEKVSEFTGSEVFLTKEIRGVAPVRPLSDFSGFVVLMKNGTLLGRVREMIRNPGHDLLSVVSGENRETLVPFHKDFIVKCDMKKKTIILDLPDGIMDLNR